MSITMKLGHWVGMFIAVVIGWFAGKKGIGPKINGA